MLQGNQCLEKPMESRAELQGVWADGQGLKEAEQAAAVSRHRHQAALRSSHFIGSSLPGAWHTLPLWCAMITFWGCCHADPSLQPLIQLTNQYWAQSRFLTADVQTNEHNQAPNSELH